MRILYLEGDRRDAEQAEAMLAADGLACEMVHVESRDGFIAALDQGGFDLIISDYTLPAYDDRSALLDARAKCPNVPFLFYSGNIGEEAAIEALKQGAVDYVLKQRPARLAPAIRRALREAEEKKERKRAEAALRESETRTRLIMDTALDAVIVMDAAGLIADWNPQAEAIFGWSRTEAVGRTLADMIVPPQYREAHTRGLKHFLATGQGPVLNKRIEITARHRDGHEFPVELAISPLRSGETVTFSAFVRDITERKQLTLRARQLAKMEMLAQILDGIAHELKNPLFIVTGNLQLLKEKLGHQPQDESLIADINQIEEAARRMDAIVRKFMLLAKPEKSQAVPCSVQSAVQESLDVLANDLMKRRVTVAMRFAPKLPDVLSEPVQLCEVFLNLILNAAQAMETAHGLGKLRVSAGQTDGWVEVRFQDDGPGVAPEYQAKIFEPFFSTKPLHEGTGLGLWTVRSIVRGLKGEIRCESEPGYGATFIVRLPGMR